MAQRSRAILPGIKSTERKRYQEERKKQDLFRHLNGMEIAQFYENAKIYCSKRKNFSTGLLLFIIFFFKRNAVGNSLKAVLLKK